MTLSALTLWLCLSGAPPRPSPAPPPPPPFAWSVPEVLDEVPIGKAPSAAGRPMKLRAVRSRWGEAALRKKLLQDFRKAGLFIPPAGHVPQNLLLPHVTALDGRRMISYSALFQANSDGSTTLILGEVDMEAKVNVPSPAPVFPGALDVLTSNLEALRTVSYRVKAAPPEVLSFYREVLGRAGYRDSGEGTFERGRERVQVMTGPAEDGFIRVVVAVAVAGGRPGSAAGAVRQDGAGAPSR